MTVMNINTYDQQPAGRPIDQYTGPVSDNYYDEYDPYAEYYDEEGEMESLLATN